MKRERKDHQAEAAKRSVDMMRSSDSKASDILGDPKVNKVIIDKLLEESRVSWSLLRKYIHTLSSGEREIFILYFIEDRSPKEIAEIIGVSVQTARYMVNKLSAKVGYFIKVSREDKKKTISNESGAHTNVELRRDVIATAEGKLEEMLLEAGLLSEIPPRITDFTPYLNRKPVKVKGKPISETIVEERS